MKTNTINDYVSPKLEMYEMVLEAPIASSVGESYSNSLGLDDATFDDWGTL